MRQVLVELPVFLVRDVRTGTRPERRRGVDDRGLFAVSGALEGDGKRNMVRVLVDEVLEPCRLRKLGFAVLEMQGDARAAVLDFGNFHREFALAVRLPAHSLGRVQAGTPRFHDNAIGHDKSRVEADAELADEPRVLLFVTRHPAQEFRGARTRDGAEVLHQLVA